MAKRLRDPYRPGERGWVKRKNPANPRYDEEREAAYRFSRRMMGIALLVNGRGATVAKEAIHTVPADNGWVNKRESSSRSLSKHATKAEAVQAGRERARRDQVEHLIHKKDGTIRARNSYGSDPRRRRG